MSSTSTMPSTVCETTVCFPPSQYTGKERDAESGLDYFGARYYASSMGRWMSPDWADKPEAVPYSSLDDPQSLNLYSYVRNNPLSRSDPDGHVDDDCGCTPTLGQLVQHAYNTFVDTHTFSYSNFKENMRSHLDFLKKAAATGNVAGNGWDVGQNYKHENTGPPNPDGQQGAPDHQAAVQEEADKARAAAGPGETVTQGTKIQVPGSTRRPDVQTVGADGKTKSVVEVERRPNSARHKARGAEYDRLGVPHTTRTLPPKQKP